VLRATAGFREEVAAALLDLAPSFGSFHPERPHVRLAKLTAPDFSMDLATALGPGSFFAENARALRSRAILVAPVYRQEIVEGESVDDFLFAASSKGAGIKLYDWTRAPTLRASFQLLDEWPGGPWRKTSAPVATRGHSAIVTLQRLTTGVRARVLDVFGRHVIVARDGDALRCEFHGPGQAEVVNLVLRNEEIAGAFDAMFRGLPLRPPR
jgi:hypothetical protein